MPGRCSCLAGSAFLSVLLAGAAIGCGGGGSDSASPARKGQVAAVIKGLDNPFFKTMDQGLLAGARKYGVPLRVAAAAGLQDTAGQASTLESLVAQEADCY